MTSMAECLQSRTRTVYIQVSHAVHRVCAVMPKAIPQVPLGSARWVLPAGSLAVVLTAIQYQKALTTALPAEAERE